MGLTDEIRELKELRDNGTITDAEFARAKAALLADTGAMPRSSQQRSAPGSDLGAAATSWVKLQIVLAIAGAIVALIFFFGFFLPNWNKSQAHFDRRLNEFPKFPPPPNFGK